MSLKTQLRGTGVAIVTPFKNGAIDYPALENLIEFLIKKQVEYIVTLGTTGETPTLSKTEKQEIVNFTQKKINKRVPLVVGIGGNNTADTIAQLSDYDLSNVAAVLSASPYYNRPSQEGIFQHYKALAEASPKPIIVYNVPGRTGSNITSETTLRLAKECPNIGGIKEASGNMVQCMHILKSAPAGFLVVSGDDHVAMPLLACGMDGVISVVANCFPEDFSEMIRLALKNDFENAQKIQYKLLDALDLLFVENNPAGVKAFLHQMDLIENELRLPLVPLSDVFYKKIADFLAAYNKL